MTKELEPLVTISEIQKLTGCNFVSAEDLQTVIEERLNTRYKRTCHDTTPYLSNGLPYPDIFTCSECGAREDGVVKEEGMYCYNCGAMFDGKHIPCGAEVVDA